MYFIQFYQRGALTRNRLIPACGDRSVIILDGRETRETHCMIARREQERRGYDGYQIVQGESFTRARALTPVHMSPECREDGCKAFAEYN